MTRWPPTLDFAPSLSPSLLPPPRLLALLYPPPLPLLPRLLDMTGFSGPRFFAAPRTRCLGLSEVRRLGHARCARGDVRFGRARLESRCMPPSQMEVRQPAGSPLDCS